MRGGRFRFVGLILVSLLVLLSSCATGKGSGFAREASEERAAQQRDSSPTTEQEAKKDDEKEAPPPPKLTILVEPSHARISINGRFIGLGQATIDSFGFGQRAEITAEAPSYRPQTVSVSLWGQTDTIVLRLEAIVGTLLVQGENLAGAHFYLPDWTVGPGANRILIGDHELVVRKFGFADQRHRVTIREGETTELELVFTAVPFALSNPFSSHPDGFNPDSAAIAASTRITFLASGPGHAEGVLLNSTGQEMARWSFPELTTWQQELRWDGRSNGVPLPDGTYHLRLTGGQDPGTDTVDLDVPIVISRALVDNDRASVGPAAGLLWTPVPEVLSTGTLQLSILGLGHVSDAIAQAPVSTAVRFAPVHGWEVFAQTSVRFWSDYHLNSLYGTFAVKQRIPIDSPNFRLAWIAGGTLGSWLYDGAGIPPTDFLTTFPALRVLLPASWSWGKWTLIVAPELDGSFWSPSTAYESASGASEGFRFWAYGRVGLSYDPGPFSVGLSGVARTRSFDNGTGWLAPAHLGLEARYPVPESPLTLTGYLSVSAYSTVDYAWYGGLGFSFLLPASFTLDLASQLQSSP